MLISNPKERGILIVDDEPNLVEMIRSYLDDAGYNRILTASNGTEALSSLASHPEEIYLVLLDLKMPSMDGLSVVKHLANVHAYYVGIVVITGYPSLDSVLEFYHSGTEKVMVMDYVLKPFKPTKLLDEIETVLQKVYEKRVGHLNMSADEMYSRLTRIEEKLSSLEKLPEILKSLREVEKKHRGTLAELGMDLLRAIVIAAGLLALLYLGVGDFIRAVIQGSH